MSENEQPQVLELSEDIAKQIVYTWRILLTQMKGSGGFSEEIPRAFNAQMYEDGTLVLRPYHIPTGVVLPGGDVEIPAPVMAAKKDGSLDLDLERRRQDRRKRAINNGQTTSHSGERRQLVSNDGHIEVLK